MREFAFKDMCKVSSTGIEVVTKLLSDSPRIASIINAENHKLFRYLDIDLIVTKKTGEVITIEIKTDTHTTGNLYIELKSNIEHNTQGWLYKSKADYIYYYFTKTNQLIAIDLESLQDHLRDFRGYKYTFNQTTVQGTKYTTLGVLIPIDALLNNCKSKVING